MPIAAAPWIWISAGVHAAVLFVGGSLFLESAKFGVQQGLSNLEVNLVAAPAASRAEPATPGSETLPAPPQPQVVPMADDLAQPVSELLKQPARNLALVKPMPTSVVPRQFNETGEGEATSVGRNKVTASSGGGARTVAKPDYQKNPPPVYPEMARAQEQDGEVLVRVEVTAEGSAAAVSLESSSGYRLLDESALRAVKNWKFMPGRIGGQAVRSVVTVPVRFNLENAR